MSLGEVDRHVRVNARVRQIGFLIADRPVGAFTLAIRSIQVE
ncbi:MAG: hypothetical protein U1F76_22875 [Candidatus Competibacteraceae bacterium]